MRLSGFAGSLALIVALTFLSGCPELLSRRLPTASFVTSGPTGFAPLVVDFTDTSTPGSAPISSWKWVIGVTVVSTAPSFDYVFEYPGTYSVSLTVTTAHGTDKVTREDYIQVQATVPPRAAFSADVTEGLPPLTVQFTDESTAGTGTEELTWLWDFGDGETSDERNPSHQYTKSGKYSVSLTVETEHGKDKETKLNLIDVAVVTGPTADFSATPVSGQDPLTVNFTDKSAPGTSDITSWVWDFGDGATGNTQNPTHTYTILGKHTVALTVTTSVGSDVVSKSDLIQLTNTVRYFGGTATDRAFDMVATEDGGFMMAGETSSTGAGEQDVYLVKSGADGNLAWSRTFGGLGDDFARALIEMADAGFSVVGGTTSEEKGLDVYLLRTAPDGNRIWSRTFGEEQDDFANALTPTADGGLAIAGSTTSMGNGLSDVYLVRTDGDGNFLWSTTYGGASFDTANAIVETADTGFALAGATTSSGGGGSDMYLIRTDAGGAELWSRTYGGINSEAAYDILAIEGGGFLLAGATGSEGEGGLDVYAIRTDADGNVVWAHTYGGEGEDRALSVIERSTGGFLFAGYTASFGMGLIDAFLLPTDAAGVPDLEEAFMTYGAANADRANTVTERPGGGFAIAGESASGGAGSLDVYLVRTDADGGVIGFP